MRDFGDLNKLIELARNNSINVLIFYGEASDEMGIEISSHAPNECFEQKIIISVEDFIQKWKEKVGIKC